MISITQSIRRRIEVVMTDITTLKVDAIVNSARSDMSVGGRTDQNVHRAAGPRLRQANTSAARGAALRAAPFSRPPLIFPAGT